MPSVELSANQSQSPLLRLTILTVCDNEKIDPQNSEALTDLVVGVLELPLHDRRIDLDDNDSSQASQNHGPTSPLIGKKFGCYGVGNERASAVYACKSEDGGRVNPEGLVEDRLIVLDHIYSRQACHCLYGDGDKCPMSVKSEDLLDGLDLAHHLVLDLSSHEGELLLCLVTGEVASNACVFNTRLLDLAFPDELARRIGHER